MFVYFPVISLWERLWWLIRQWDVLLFIKINNYWTNDFFDAVLPISRDSNTWIPLYLFMIVFMFLNFKNKAWIWILFAVVNVVITDQVSSHLIKLFVQRLRPCADPFLQYHVRLMVDHCSGGFSFTSSHATNHFGFAAFVFFTFRDMMKKWAYLWFVWAAIICYAQVYVGVHYPADVLCGALLGCGIGFIMSSFYVSKYGTLQLSYL
jgi:membrane-associated phospholipid phosphatase